jgi:DNA-binding NtrC family response regulator
VFLDEIGELDPAIQVKLLRVMQTRQFQRIGETTPRHFAGKVIAATNRDLEEEIGGGRFRDDLYYRICADQITMPTLREQLADSPDDLCNLLRIVAVRSAGIADADHVAHEAHEWVNKHLGRDYSWPGNMRELEQCLRNVLIRGSYRPRRAARNGDDPLVAALSGARMTAEELLQCYCATVYGETGSYQETARRLGLDRRTVQAKATAWARRKRAAAPD